MALVVLLGMPFPAHFTAWGDSPMSVLMFFTVQVQQWHRIPDAAAVPGGVGRLFPGKQNLHPESTVDRRRCVCSDLLAGIGLFQLVHWLKLAFIPGLLR
jgi:hypothetical protein